MGSPVCQVGGGTKKPATTTTKAQATTTGKSKYVVEKLGRHSCSKGAVVNTESKCRQAAAANGKKLSASDSWSGEPKGCFVTNNGYWYFNKHSKGKADSQRSRVCQVAGSGTTKKAAATTTKAKATTKGIKYVLRTQDFGK